MKANENLMKSIEAFTYRKQRLLEMYDALIDAGFSDVENHFIKDNKDYGEIQDSLVLELAKANNIYTRI